MERFISGAEIAELLAAESLRRGVSLRQLFRDAARSGRAALADGTALVYDGELWHRKAGGEPRRLSDV